MEMPRHDGDCMIYSSLVNCRVNNGICNCGYGKQCWEKGNLSEMYSGELEKKLLSPKKQENLLEQTINKYGVKQTG